MSSKRSSEMIQGVEISFKQSGEHGVLVLTNHNDEKVNVEVYHPDRASKTAKYEMIPTSYNLKPKNPEKLKAKNSDWWKVKCCGQTREIEIAAELQAEKAELSSAQSTELSSQDFNDQTSLSGEKETKNTIETSRGSMMDLSNLIYEKFYRTNDSDLQVRLHVHIKLSGQLSFFLEIFNMTSKKKRIKIDNDENNLFQTYRYRYPIEDLNISTINIKSYTNKEWLNLQIVHETKDIKKLQEENEKLLVQMRNGLEQIDEIKNNSDKLTDLIARSESQLQRFEENDENLRAVKGTLEKIAQLQNGGILSRLANVEPQINRLTRQLSDVEQLLSKAQNISNQMKQRKSEVKEEAESSKEQLEEIRERQSESEKLLESLNERAEEADSLIADISQRANPIKEVYNLLQGGEFEKNYKKVKDLLSEAKTAATQMNDKITQIRESAEISDKQLEETKKRQNESEKLLKSLQKKQTEVNETGDAAQKKMKKISSDAETIQHKLEMIEQEESEFRKNSSKAWEQWIQQENSMYFQGAAEDFKEQQLQKLHEQTKSGVSPEKQKNLHRAKDLLDDFCDRMNQAEKTIPPSIQNACERIHSLHSQLEVPLPSFQPPDLLSLQEHSTKQKELIASAILENASPQRQSYESYVETEYTQALREYTKQLMEEIKHAPEPLTDDELKSQFRDLASMTLNAFYPYDEMDENRRKIFVYYDKKVLPPLLDAFGFEEIPITIGKTKAMETLHDITESRQSEHPSGTVIEVLYKGFRKKDDPGGVVQKARVIRAE